MLLTKFNKGKVQIFWERQKNLAHLPLFIWHYMLRSVKLYCGRWDKYAWHSQNILTWNSCTLNLPKFNILFHKDQLTALLLPNKCRKTVFNACCKYSFCNYWDESTDVKIAYIVSFYYTVKFWIWNFLHLDTHSFLTNVQFPIY